MTVSISSTGPQRPPDTNRHGKAPGDPRAANRTQAERDGEQQAGGVSEPGAVGRGGVRDRDAGDLSAAWGERKTGAAAAMGWATCRING